MSIINPFKLAINQAFAQISAHASILAYSPAVEISKGATKRGDNIYPAIHIGGAITDNSAALTIGPSNSSGTGGTDQHTVQIIVMAHQQGPDSELAYMGDDANVIGIVDIAADIIEATQTGSVPDGFQTPFELVNSNVIEPDLGGSLIASASLIFKIDLNIGRVS